MQLPALPGAQKLERLQAHLSAQQDKEKLRFQVQQLTAHTSPANLEIRALQGALQKLGNVMQLDDVRLQTDQTTLVANGVLPGGAQDASLTLHAQSQDLTEIGRLLQNDVLQGPADLVLKAEGPPEAVEIHSQLSSTSGHIAIQGHLNAAATPPQYSGTLDVTNLNLAALRQQGAWHSDLNCNSALTASAYRHRSGMVRYSSRSAPHACGRLSYTLRTLTLRSKPSRCRCNASTLTPPLPIQR